MKNSENSHDDGDIDDIDDGDIDDIDDMEEEEEEGAHHHLLPLGAPDRQQHGHRDHSLRQRIRGLQTCSNPEHLKSKKKMVKSNSKERHPNLQKLRLLGLLGGLYIYDSMTFL